MHCLDIRDEVYSLMRDPFEPDYKKTAMADGATYGDITVTRATVTYHWTYQSFEISVIQIAANARGEPDAYLGDDSSGFERSLYEMLKAQILDRHSETLAQFLPQPEPYDKMSQREFL